MFGTEKGSTALNRAARENETRYSPLVLHYFDRTLSLCKEKNIPVIVTTMPFGESSYGHLSTNYIQSYASVMQVFQEKYPKFYVETSIRVLPDKYFGNSSHVNIEGTKVVTASVRQLLVQRGFVK